MKFPLLTLRAPPVLFALFLALTLGYLTVELIYQALMDSYKKTALLQVQGDADILTRITMTGNAMGAVSALGLVNPAVKAVLKNEIPADDAAAMESLQAIHDAYAATGVFIVRPDGIVQSNVVSLGTNLNGDKVGFRPYFKRAMQGERNVYVAISTSTGLRAIFAAAPVYETQSDKSAIIGAAVIRLPDDQLTKIMNRSTHGASFLLSPQQVVFSSNQREWFGHMAIQPTESELSAIRNLKQFGKSFLEKNVRLLPFDVRSDTVIHQGRRYLVSRATVNWDDPNGEWRLVMLADLSSVMPLHYKLVVGTTSGIVVLILSLLMMQLRSKLVVARAKRSKAEDELKVYTSRLEVESEVKSFLADLSIQLQQTENYTDFAKVLISDIAPRMAASYIALYVYKHNSNTFVPIGSYGVSEQSLTEFKGGQGLIGQASMDGQTLLLEDTKNLPIKIQSGLGYDLPKAVLLVPIKQTDRLLGTMVLASLRGFNSSQLALQEELQPIMAVQLSILSRYQDGNAPSQ